MIRPEGHADGPLRDSPLDRCLRAGIEALLLAMAVAAPWGLGGVAPVATVGLNVGLGLVLTLWGRASSSPGGSSSASTPRSSPWAASPSFPPSS